MNQLSCRGCVKRVAGATTGAEVPSIVISSKTPLTSFSGIMKWWKYKGITYYFYFVGHPTWCKCMVVVRNFCPKKYCFLFGLVWYNAEFAWQSMQQVLATSYLAVVVHSQLNIRPRCILLELLGDIFFGGMFSMFWGDFFPSSVCTELFTYWTNDPFLQKGEQEIVQLFEMKQKPNILRQFIDLFPPLGHWSPQMVVDCRESYPKWPKHSG